MRFGNTFLFLISFLLTLGAQPACLSQEEVNPYPGVQLRPYIQEIPADPNQSPPVYPDSSLPAMPPVMPPPLPERPLRPLLEAVTEIPSNHQPANFKMPLAWRATAYKNNGGSSKTFAIPYSEALMGLLAACPQAGYNVETFSSTAGQLLVKANSSQIKVVLTVAETTAGSTTIRASALGENSTAKQAAVSALLDAITDVLAKRGSI
jgi:hypothetical protein